MTRIKLRECIIAVLVFGMIGILSACTEKPSSSPQPPPSSLTDTSQEDAGGTAASNESGVTSETSSILITYFAVAENSEVDAISSASVREIGGEAKGHIRVLADVIQSNVGGEMFSIQTSTEYPVGIRELIDYADKEQEKNTRPELTTHIENLEDYDVIFIGYPNWWYDMPMIMYSFFEEYDFSGKTIILFCTHNGSGFSSTMNTIRELEPNATVLDGFTTNGNNVEDVDSDVIEWISRLGI